MSKVVRKITIVNFHIGPPFFYNDRGPLQLANAKSVNRKCYVCPRATDKKVQRGSII